MLYPLSYEGSPEGKRVTRSWSDRGRDVHDNFGAMALTRSGRSSAGSSVARCTIELLLRQLELCGAARGEPKRRSPTILRRGRDLVDREFTAVAPTDCGARI